MKKGDIIYAIDPCIMEDDNYAALTVGKEYVVESMERVLLIRDDQGDLHYFEQEDIEKFFTTVNPAVLLSRLDPKIRKILNQNVEQGIPIFTLIAKDNLSVEVLIEYLHLASKQCSRAFSADIAQILTDFMQWRAINPSRTKTPD